jgi:hypothetical protein
LILIVWGGVCISTEYNEKFEIIFSSDYQCFIDCNLKKGVAPYRIENYLKKNFDVHIDQNILMEYRRTYFKNVTTVKNEEIDEDCLEFVHNNEEFTNPLDLAYQINIELGKRIKSRLDTKRDLDGKENQLYSTTLKVIVDHEDYNNQKTENLSDLISENTIVMLNDRAK